MPQKAFIEKRKKLNKIENSETSIIQPKEETDKNNESDTNNLARETFSLYVRGAAWIKNRDNAEIRLKGICPKIQAVRHPRQKSADYCFIDFASANERDHSYEELKINPELNVKPITKDVPKSLRKRKKIVAERREAKSETRKLLAKIKKNGNSNGNYKEKTNQLIIANLPVQATTDELKKQFVNAVKIQLKKQKTKKKSSAIITFSNPHNAFLSSKHSFTMHGQTLNAFLNTNASFRKVMKSKRKHPVKKQDEELAE